MPEYVAKYDVVEPFSSWGSIHEQHPVTLVYTRTFPAENIEEAREKARMIRSDLTDSLTYSVSLKTVEEAINNGKTRCSNPGTTRTT